ncbi:MAG: DUF58 domain-containing protein [Planctomycetota bacterium]
MATSRVVLRPTGLGARGMLLFAVLELAFLATSYNNLFFLMLAFSIALGALGALWAWRNVHGIEVARLELRAAAVGQRREAYVQLRTKRRSAGLRPRPRFGIAAQLDTGQGYVEAAWFALLEGQAECRGELPPQERGVCDLKRIRIATDYPFGLIRARIDVACDAECITYPDPQIAQLAHGTPRPLEQNSGNSPGGAGRSTTLAGLRAYRTGDSIGDIHWRATARRGRPIIKEREAEQDQEVPVVVDRRCSSEELETALSAATAQVLAARDRGRIRLVSQGCELLVDAERGGAPEALRWLAAARVLPTSDPSPQSSTAAPTHRYEAAATPSRLTVESKA